MKVAVVCPTRDRPEAFTRLSISVHATARDADLFSYIDDDQRDLYRSSNSGVHGSGRDFHGPRIGPIAAANKLVEMNPGYDAYGFLTDDCEVTTENWDQWLFAAIDQMPNRVGAVSPHLEGIPYLSFPFLTRAWIDAVGFFAYPRAYHFCWDTIVEILAEPTCLVKAPADRFSIRHPNHTSMNVKDHFERDSRSFLFWAIRERRELTQKIREAMAA